MRSYKGKMPQKQEKDHVSAERQGEVIECGKLGRRCVY